jgi:hypothetical protein
MPFANVAQSAAAKAKNNHLVGEIPPDAETKLHLLTFLPLLPPPV